MSFAGKESQETVDEDAIKPLKNGQVDKIIRSQFCN